MISESKLRQFLFGPKTISAWNGSAGFQGTEQIRRYYLSLSNRACWLGWSDSDILALLDRWHHDNRLEPATDWQVIATEMIAIAHRDTRPRRPARSKAIADTGNWETIQTALQNRVLGLPEIVEITGLSTCVVKHQLHRKFQIGWVSQPRRGVYELTNTCGQQRPRKPRRRTVETADQVPATIEELLEEQAKIQSRLSDIREYNKNLKIEAQERDRQYPRGKAWSFMPGELKQMYVDQYGVYRSATIPGRRFRGTNRLIDTLIEIEQELDRLGYIPDQYEIDEIAA